MTGLSLGDVCYRTRNLHGVEHWDLGFKAGQKEVRDFFARNPSATNGDFLIRASGLSGNVLRKHWPETGAKCISRQDMLRYLVEVNLDPPQPDPRTLWHGLGMLFELAVGRPRGPKPARVIERLHFNVCTLSNGLRGGYYVRIWKRTAWGQQTLHQIYGPSYRACCDMARALREGYEKRGKL